MVDRNLRGDGLAEVLGEPCPVERHRAVAERVHGVLYGPVLTTGFGDPAIDQVCYRRHQPAALAGNVTARGARRRRRAIDPPQVLLQRRHPAPAAGRGGRLRDHPLSDQPPPRAGARAPRRGADLQRGPGRPFLGQRGAVFPRAAREAQYANLRHRDGGGTSRPWPASFDYRTIETDFTIWGWRVRVERDAVEFLHLTGVTRDGLTLKGTGTVTLEPPASCAAGTTTVDLGPSQPIDEHASAGNNPSYGNTKAVVFR